MFFFLDLWFLGYVDVDVDVYIVGYLDFVSVYLYENVCSLVDICFLYFGREFLFCFSCGCISFFVVVVCILV